LGAPPGTVAGIKFCVRPFGTGVEVKGDKISCTAGSVFTGTVFTGTFFTGAVIAGTEQTLGGNTLKNELFLVIYLSPLDAVTIDPLMAVTMNGFGLKNEVSLFLFC
jgi:hypothetical protein